MKKRQVFISIILICIMSNYESFAQKLDRKLKVYAQEMDFKYKKPVGFVALDSGTFIKTNICTLKTEKKKEWHLPLSAPFDYSIISKKKDIVITFMIMYRFNTENYYRTMQLYADTISRYIIHYSSRYIKKTSHATKVSLYVPNCPYLHKKEYPHIKVVIMYKKGEGIIQLFYYYTDKAANKIDKCIKRTANMIRFKT